MTLDKTYTAFVRTHKELLQYMKSPIYKVQKVHMFSFNMAVVTYKCKEEHQTEHSFYNPVLAAFCTATARCYLYEKGMEVAGDRLLYTGMKTNPHFCFFFG